MENEIENQKIITTYRKDQPPKNLDELIEILEQKMDEYDFRSITQMPNPISVQYH